MREKQIQVIILFYSSLVNQKRHLIYPCRFVNSNRLLFYFKYFHGLTALLSSLTSKCKCGPVDLPVEPTSAILSRELNIPVKVNLNEVRKGGEIPPTADMEGFDLVTEGTITLSRALRALEEDASLEAMPDNAVKRLILILLDSDIIEFVVGTKINEAHQDPALPKDLEIRRNLMKQFVRVLEKKHLKTTRVLFV